MLPDGTRVGAIEPKGSNGVMARVITPGATLQALEVPDRDGRMADVTLGYYNGASHVRASSFWGQTVGRDANRIAGGRFALEGRTDRLPLDDKTNSLPGGREGSDKRARPIVSVADGQQAKVVTALTSPAGDQGYQGKPDVTATCSLDDRGSLTIDVDAPTVVSLTNHALFNLADEDAPTGIDGQRLTIPAARSTPVNAGCRSTRATSSTARSSGRSAMSTGWEPPWRWSRRPFPTRRTSRLSGRRTSTRAGLITNASSYASRRPADAPGANS